MVFRDGGKCENQTIRRLQVEHNGMEVFSCSNIVGNASQPCFSTEKYHVDNSECPQDCVASSLLQCCKFRFFLTIMDFNESDAGTYVASVTVEEDGGSPRDMTKTFELKGMRLA